MPDRKGADAKSGRKDGGVPEKARKRTPHVPVKVRRTAERIDEGERGHTEQEQHRCFEC
jgi:hypothetical protein